MKVCTKVFRFGIPLLCVLPLQAFAANNGAPQAVLTAVVDINACFEKHTRFKQKMDQLKSEVESFESEINAQRKEVSNQRKQLDMLQPQSRQYREIEEKIARSVSQIQVRAQLKRKEIVDREAQSYYQAYSDIQAAVRKIADAHNIALVIRFDSSKIDPQKRASVIKGVNQPVVYQRNLDITQMVVQQINRPDGQY